MIGPYGRPTAAELVAAVAEFLETDVRGATSGQVNFHARVAANALRIVERELLDEGEPDCGAALASLGCTDEEGLAGAIRAGEMNGRAEGVIACLRTLVRHRLAVAHPGYDSEQLGDDAGRAGGTPPQVGGVPAPQGSTPTRLRGTARG